MTLLLEYWKPVVGWEDFYQVSNTGRIISIRNSINTWFGREMKGVPNQKSGRPYVTLWDGKRRVSAKVHNVVSAAFHGPRPTGYDVNHKNGCVRKNWVSNLEYITPEENRAHALANGLCPRGERNGASKLREADIVAIRALRTKETYASIAKRYNVAMVTIGLIMRRKVWSHVP